MSLQLLWKNPNFFVTQALNIYRLKDVVIKWTYIGTGMCWKLHRRSHIIGSMLKSIFKSSGQKGGHMSLKRNQGLNVIFIKMILIITSNLQYENYRFCLITINITSMSIF